MDLYRRENASLLVRSLGASPKIRIIDFLLDNPLLDFTKKEIMEVLGMSKKTLYRALPDLEEQGIVMVSRKIGRAKLYKINLQHPLVKALREHEKRLSLQEAEKGRAKEATIIP